MQALEPLPSYLEPTRQAAQEVLVEIVPAGQPRSRAEEAGLLLSARTNSGRGLPHYYLVYFLLVDLLKYPSLGQYEKTAWVVPIRFNDRLYSIDHRKAGVGVFCPNLKEGAHRSELPNAEAESDALKIVIQVTRAVAIAEPYFEWRAKQAVATPRINVVNKCEELHKRLLFFRDKFFALKAEAIARKDERVITKSVFAGGSATSVVLPYLELEREAVWIGQAAVEAFFSWTEHAFIHIAILSGKLRTGDAVAAHAAADWKQKYRSALDITDPVCKEHYDTLLDLRAQIRNFMAHGAFGKRGEAFSFHSGAGAVPVLLTSESQHRYKLSSSNAFDEHSALEAIDAFEKFLWFGNRSRAQTYLFSGLASILSYVDDGTYDRAMSSEGEMAELIERLLYETDRSANMDF